MFKHLKKAVKRKKKRCHAGHAGKIGRHAETCACRRHRSFRKLGLFFCLQLMLSLGFGFMLGLKLERLMHKTHIE